MSYKPPFTITSEILNLVADISQQVGRLDASALNASPQLRKQNRIKTLAQNAPVTAPENAPVNFEGMKTPEAILPLLQDNNQLTRQQLAKHIGKDVRTIARAIAKLQQTGQLTRIGSDKTGHWEVHL